VHSCRATSLLRTRRAIPRDSSPTSRRPSATTCTVHWTDRGDGPQRGPPPTRAVAARPFATSSTGTTPTSGFLEFQRTDSVFHARPGDDEAVRRIYGAVDDAVGQVLDDCDPDNVVPRQRPRDGRSTTATTFD